MSLPTPNTRKEQYLNAIATGNADGLPTPITREEEYLDAIAKGGGGSGDGDMKKSVYDSDLDVAGAGGIKAFVNSAVAGKVDKVEGKGLSTNDYTDEDKAIVGGVTGALAEKADTDDIPDLVSDNLAKGILGNETVLSTDNVPFVSKIMSAGKYQRKKFVGCSFVWNQLVDSNTESVTIASGHKYALYQNGAWSIGVSDGTAIAVTGGSDLFTDLTQLFGSTAIADAIYSLEQATAGAGVAKLKELGFFTDDYYAYDAGSVQSVDIKEYSVIGFNLWDEQWELGTFDTTTGSNRAVSNQIRSKNYIPIKGDTNYYFKGGDWVIFFNVNKNVITDDLPSGSRSGNSVLIRSREFKTPKNSAYMRFYCLDSYGKTYKNDMCLNFSDPARNGQYEPYHKTTYPLTPTELRGVPKIDANNNIYCDGDEYASDGGHTVKYDIVDLGTLNWDKWTAFDSVFYSNSLNGLINIPGVQAHLFMICDKYINVQWDGFNRSDKVISFYNDGTTKRLTVKDTQYRDTTKEDFKTAMSGVYLVYKKKTPTTETLTPFDYPQSVGSLEEIVDYKVEQEDRDVAIPTGHVTEYMGKGGEFTLPTLPETPSVLAFDGHNFFWKPETA